MYRLYNPNSGEHFYTAKADERDGLVKVGWKYEGIGWVAPVSSNTPVYRLYNGSNTAGDHHYTMDKGERDGLIAQGWKDEGIGWYSDDAKKVPLYREYNPNARTGTHNYTTGKAEHDALVAQGWKDEKIGWYALQEGRADNTSAQTPAQNPSQTPSQSSSLSSGVEAAATVSYIKLGSYEQDNNTENGKEPIEWLVVGKRDGHTLLVSRYALAHGKKYNDDWADTTWESCSIRKWLNNDFYNAAFSDADRSRIVTAHNQNPDSYELYKPQNTSIRTYGANGGNATDDKVFFLSWTEVRDAFGGALYQSSLGKSNYNQKLLCRPSAYELAHGIGRYNNQGGYPEDTDQCCSWWLRSPGSTQKEATVVAPSGSLEANEIGITGSNIGIRPAILID